jgi:hypothetical protein
MPLDDRWFCPSVVDYRVSRPHSASSRRAGGAAARPPSARCHPLPTSVSWSHSSAAPATPPLEKGGGMGVYGRTYTPSDAISGGIRMSRRRPSRTPGRRLVQSRRANVRDGQHVLVRLGWAGRTIDSSRSPSTRRPTPLPGGSGDGTGSRSSRGVHFLVSITLRNPAPRARPAGGDSYVSPEAGRPFRAAARYRPGGRSSGWPLKGRTDTAWSVTGGQPRMLGVSSIVGASASAGRESTLISLWSCARTGDKQAILIEAAGGERSLAYDHGPPIRRAAATLLRATRPW